MQRALCNDLITSGAAVSLNLHTRSSGWFACPRRYAAIRSAASREISKRIQSNVERRVAEMRARLMMMEPGRLARSPEHKTHLNEISYGLPFSSKWINICHSLSYKTIIYSFTYLFYWPIDIYLYNLSLSIKILVFISLIITWSNWNPILLLSFSRIIIIWLLTKNYYILSSPIFQIGNWVWSLYCFY